MSKIRLIYVWGVLLLALSVPLVTEAIPAIEQGASRQEVLERWGEPAGSAQLGREELLLYEGGREVRLREGRVVSVVGGPAMTSERIVMHPDMETPVQMPAWMEAQMQRALERQMDMEFGMEEELPLWAGIALFAFWLAVILLMQISIWIVFSKAGRPGWASLIPFYNAIVLLQISGKPGWWILLTLIPGVNFVIMILMDLALAERFGKGPGFGLGLLFLPVIFLPILAFSRTAIYEH